MEGGGSREGGSELGWKDGWVEKGFDASTKTQKRPALTRAATSSSLREHQPHPDRRAMRQSVEKSETRGVEGGGSEVDAMEEDKRCERARDGDKDRAAHVSQHAH